MTAEDVTQLLIAWRNGDVQALDKLTPLVYSELRRIAHARLRRERADHSLQATDLVHETFLRLTTWQQVSWQNRAHFFALAAQLMRNILVDYARSREAGKRGGGQQKVTLEAAPAAAAVPYDLLALDDALTALAAFDAQQSHIVELRYFGGLSIEETAEALGISPSTVKREWLLARTWLLREMSNNDEG